MKLAGRVDFPRHSSGGFDHGDVHAVTGRVFVAHSANGTVEVFDGVRMAHLATIPGCDEASGVLGIPGSNQIVAAARGSGKILLIDALTLKVVKETPVGSKPNGLAWDSRRRHLLVADVEDDSVRILSLASGELLNTVRLPGRPRWCVYDERTDRFLVNIREPSGVFSIPADSMNGKLLSLSRSGAHGLDIERGTARAFVACDDGSVVVVDADIGAETSTVPISGGPDAIWFNPLRNRLYCAIGKPGVVDVIDTLQYLVSERISTEPGAHTIAFDSARQRLYVFLPGSCSAAVYDDVS